MVTKFLTSLLIFILINLPPVAAEVTLVCKENPAMSAMQPHKCCYLSVSGIPDCDLSRLKDCYCEVCFSFAQKETLPDSIRPANTVKLSGTQSVATLSSLHLSER